MQKCKFASSKSNIITIARWIPEQGSVTLLQMKADFEQVYEHKDTVMKL